MTAADQDNGIGTIPPCSGGAGVPVALLDIPGPSLQIDDKVTFVLEAQPGGHTKAVYVDGGSGKWDRPGALHGEVKFFLVDKGYGFVTIPSATGPRNQDIYVHLSDVRGNLTIKGEIVSFDRKILSACCGMLKALNVRCGTGPNFLA